MAELAPLTGAYRYSLDGKGRTVMPAPFRAHFGTGCWLTRGTPSVLVAFHRDRFPAFAAHWMDDPQASLLYLGSTQWMSFQPATGRVPIPLPLREVAGLHPWSEVALVGMRDAVLVMPWARWSTETERIGRWMLARWADGLQGRLSL